MFLPGIDCAISLAPSHPDLKVVKHRGLTCKKRRTYFISGISPEVNFSTYNNSIDAAERAVKERVLFVPNEDGSFSQPPQPTSTAYTSGMSRILSIFRKHAFYATPMEPLHFAMTYQGRKQTLY
jgi:hypothetical protein